MAIFGSGSRQGGMSTINMALLGVLAYRTLKGKGRLADMLGQQAPAGQTPQSTNAGLGGLLGGLGGLGGMGGLASIFGGAGAGNAISDGLRHLMDRFQQNGQGNKVQSWVSSGANEPIAPHELEQGLGEERIQWLTQQTGMSRDELLAGLSQRLPEAVNQLTPEGRVPDPQEAEQHLRTGTVS